MKFFRCLHRIYRISNLEESILKLNDEKTNDCVVDTFQHICRSKIIQNAKHNINELCAECLHPRKLPTLFEFPIQQGDFNSELKDVCTTKLHGSALAVYSMYNFFP